MHHWNDTGLRLTDADRTRALKRLGRHHRAGRVDDEEFAERGDAIRSARTYGDLVTVFGDLEPSARFQALAATGLARPGGFARGPRHAGLPVVPLLLVAIALAAFDVLPWVPVLVIGGLFLLFAPLYRGGGWGHRGWHGGRRGWAC